MPPPVESAIVKAGGIGGLMADCPSDKHLRGDAKRYQSLADRTRLKILWAVSKTELCPCVLKVIGGVTDSKLSYHLRVLEEAGMVKSRRMKNWVLYSITDIGRQYLKPRHR